ncbi:Dihydroorotate dehydrogenase B (NAD(+)), catalytic subunit [Stieleria maiorica]|uniref:Dihydroorotate dehydrogenase B (NAD(+)), catalytic subunit n=1 Tax=Stieleria maiorica TaxID=2795974 RepID=A0A5B9M9I0_9BACT|nr:dihydroorotate dehydrogenase [Stieleria maiorica]QEF97842.1 Dihydroorotate dehydrogenase B (NAD(+)), catalytic subunit [Stieleria maiorica]
MSLDLTTNFGGLRLHSPLIVGACPLTGNTKTRIALERAGAGAIVLPSLFEEHVIAWRIRDGGPVTEREQRLLDRMTGMTRRALVPDVETYLAMLNRASVQSNIPVIASLHGGTDGDWLDFAGELQVTGANAIELNVHHRPDNDYDEPRELENQVVNLVKEIRASIRVPLFLKLHREYTAVSHLARRLVSGVQGLVLYARDPEIDIALDNFKLQCKWGLSPPGVLSPTLRALMSVYGHCPTMPLAGNGGIGRPEDVIKTLLAGADAAMVVSAVYREGPDIIRTMLDGLTRFMESHRIRSLNELNSKRPMEFSSEEERRNTIEGLSLKPGFNGIGEGEHVIRSDKWGHPVV